VTTVAAKSRLSRYAQLTGACFLTVGIVLAMIPAGRAAASTLTSGPVTLVPAEATAPVDPFSSGEAIDIEVAANSTMNRSSLAAAGFPSGAVPIKVLECADPGGLAANLPTKPTECEPGTIASIAGAGADGSMQFVGSNAYMILALPDPYLGSSNGTECDNGANACVLGIFADQNDFTKPHLFSASFQVAAASPSSGGGSSNSSTNTSSATSTGASGSSAGAPSITQSSAPTPRAASTSSGTLAFTGVQSVVPWLIGLGLLLLLVGSLGRRFLAKGSGSS
jgi:hypothetical protein